VSQLAQAIAALEIAAGNSAGYANGSGACATPKCAASKTSRPLGRLWKSRPSRKPLGSDARDGMRNDSRSDGSGNSLRNSGHGHASCAPARRVSTKRAVGGKTAGQRRTWETRCLISLERGDLASAFQVRNGVGSPFGSVFGNR
jgi:hypothetical protein